MEIAHSNGTSHVGVVELIKCKSQHEEVSTCDMRKSISPYSQCAVNLIQNKCGQIDKESNTPPWL